MSGVNPAAETPPTARARRRSRWRALADAVAAVRSTDPASVESALRSLGGRRRWLAPLVYAAGTVAVVFDGVLLLLRNWRLTLLQLFPAAWISIMTWNMKSHLVSKPSLSTGVAIAAAIGVLLAAQVAYWSNATFAYTMAKSADGDIRAAFAEARPHWRLIGGLALLTGGVQAVIWLLLPHLHANWLWVALFVMFVVQIYLFIAIPCWLLGVRKTGSTRERMTQSATTGVLSGVASTPGFLLNRLGWLLLGTGLGILGGVLVAIGAVLHVTASSSVRVVKLSVRLRGEGPTGSLDRSRRHGGENGWMNVRVARPNPIERRCRASCATAVSADGRGRDRHCDRTRSRSQRSLDAGVRPRRVPEYLGRDVVGAADSHHRRLRRRHTAPPDRTRHRRIRDARGHRLRGHCHRGNHLDLCRPSSP